MPAILDEEEEKFFEALRAAAFLFETEPRGRFKACILACRAVEEFIKVRDRGAELAGPFHRIAEAFEFLDRNKKPSLFEKKTARGKQRSQSPDHKVKQRLAAVFVQVLHRLGDPLELASVVVSAKVNRWTGFEQQKVTAKTVLAWRKSLLHDGNFKLIVEKTLEERNPRRTVEEWLKRGPIGQPKG